MPNASNFAVLMKQTAVDSLADAKAKIVAIRQRLALAYMLTVALAASGMHSFAQVSIDISPDDLNVFFDWFNTMFGVILPIALIGAGLVAGATFAFVVGNMLKKAFQSLGGGG